VVSSGMACFQSGVSGSEWLIDAGIAATAKGHQGAPSPDGGINIPLKQVLR